MNNQSVLGPLSEVFGRLGVYHATNIIFTISTLASARSPNLMTLIVLRFVAGCAASAPNSVGAGTMADIVPLQFRGKVMSVAVVAPLLGLAVGPMIGGPLVDAYGWRSTVYFTAAAVGVQPHVLSYLEYLREYWLTQVEWPREVSSPLPLYS